MTLSPRILHIVKLTILISCLLFTAYYALSSPSLPASLSSPQASYKALFSGKKGSFITTASTSEIDGPFDNSTLVELCRSRTWTPGLIFKCEDPSGGIANVRNIILNCVRYAIEAGATGFIIPTLLVPSPPPARPQQVPFDHFFDTTHFTTTLSTSCPQIHIYTHQNDLWDKPSTASPIRLNPSSLQTPLLYNTILSSPQTWAQSFAAHLNKTYTRPITPSLPILITLQSPLLQFPLSYDPPLLITNLGKLLRFSPSLRALSSSILYSLSTTHHLNLSPGPGIQPKKYYGAHLRTAPDAQAAGWTTYETQSTNYLLSAQTANLTTIYISSHNPIDVLRFKILCYNQSLPISVHSAESLLGGPLLTTNEGNVRNGAKGFENEWMLYQGLTGEQKGAVDYEVLLRSSVFGGTYESSFSWGVAMRRHVVASGEKGWVGFSPASGTGHGAKMEGRGVRPGVKEAAVENARKQREGEATVGARVGEVSFQDRLSAVFGGRGEGKGFELGLWP